MKNIEDFYKKRSTTQALYSVKNYCFCSLMVIIHATF